MAVYREEPKCPFCGEVNGKNVYIERENFFGDTFSHVEYYDHECDQEIEFREKVKKQQEEFRQRIVEDRDSTTFKTLVNDLGEYCILDISLFQNVYTATSCLPRLYPSSATIELLKEQYSKFVFEDTQEPFDWDKDVPSDWKLIECKVKIKE
jgi:hypothetical protein